MFPYSIVKGRCKMKEKFSATFSVIATALSRLIGGFDGYFYVVLLMMILDFISGLLVGAKEKKLSPDIAFHGVTKKFMIILIIILSVGADQIMGTTGAIRLLAIFYYCGTEGLSVIKNASLLGLPVPDRIKNVFEGMTEDKTVENKII